MSEFIKNLTARDIIKLLSTVGVWIICLGFMWIFYKVVTNDIPHLTEAIENQTKIIESQSLILGNLNNSIQLNTEYLKGLIRK